MDPKGGRVVGTGSSEASNHPLKHAVMVAIDSVAAYQGGGVWKPGNGHSDR